jgi:SAM-dependent methyltransferase
LQHEVSPDPTVLERRDRPRRLSVVARAIRAARSDPAASMTGRTSSMSARLRHATREDGPVTWEQLRSSYDVVASKYETRFLDELRDKPRDRELLRAFSESVSDPVFEIGCGPGQIGVFVRQRGRRVFGLDLSPQMARLANRRLDGALAADMRSLPLAPERIGGLIAFYSLIHVRRADLCTALREFHRVLRPGGRVLFSAHEGQGEVERDQFLEEPVPFVATLFELDELVDASRAAGLTVSLAERRTPYPSESTVRLYVEATRSNDIPSGRSNDTSARRTAG